MSELNVIEVPIIGLSSKHTSEDKYKKSGKFIIYWAFGKIFIGYERYATTMPLSWQKIMSNNVNHAPLFDA